MALEQLTFRRLYVADADAVMALSRGVWWMENRDKATVQALLQSSAVEVYGLFDDAVLIATGSLLTDRLTKAVLVDVAVAASLRGKGVGTCLMENIMRTLPASIEGILYCKQELEAFYRPHGFAVDGSYSLMLRR